MSDPPPATLLPLFLCLWSIWRSQCRERSRLSMTNPRRKGESPVAAPICMSADLLPSRHKSFTKSVLRRPLRQLLVGLGAVLCHLSPPPPAFAKPTASVNPTPEENLLEAQLDFQKATRSSNDQLRAYLALHKMWSAWSEIDPLIVEHALLVAAEDTSKPAPI